MCRCCFADTNTHRVTASKAPKCRLNDILKAVKQLVCECNNICIYAYDLYLLDEEVVEVVNKVLH